jgi:tRNA (cmo5U34)-methyltransferase
MADWTETQKNDAATWGTCARCGMPRSQVTRLSLVCSNGHDAEDVRSDDLVPSGPWAFDDDVARVFDDMLERSIPQYEVMRRAVFDLGSLYVEPKTAIVDLGASRGEALAPFVSRFGAANHYVAAEISEPMLDALRERFPTVRNFPPGVIGEAMAWDNLPMIDVRKVDLRTAFPVTRSECSVVLAVLTLMFVPIEHRQRVVQNAFDSLALGGAFVVVEKIVGGGSVLEERFAGLYRDSKARAGYSDEQIARKALALEGVLVPQTAAANERMLKDAGFRTVECFWRWMNFAGWVAVK